MFTARRDDPCDRYHRTPHSPASRDFPINPAAAAAAAEEDRPDLRHPAEEAAAAVPLHHQSQEGGGVHRQEGAAPSHPVATAEVQRRPFRAVSALPALPRVVEDRLYRRPRRRPHHLLHPHCRSIARLQSHSCSPRI